MCVHVCKCMHVREGGASNRGEHFLWRTNSSNGYLFSAVGLIVTLDFVRPRRHIAMACRLIIQSGKTLASRHQGCRHDIRRGGGRGSVHGWMSVTIVLL